MSIMQLVQDVNAIAEDMGKQVTFNIVLVSAAARGLEEGGRTEVSKYTLMLTSLPESLSKCFSGSD